MEALRVLDSWGEYGAARGVRRYDDITISAFVENQLQDIVPQMYDKLFPELDARDHVPTGNTQVSPGAMAWGYDSMDKRGKAEFLGANATDMPRADISRRRLTFPIRTIIIAYGWTVEEIEAARFANVQLERGKADAARRAIAELEHNTLLQGDTSRNLPGFLTNPATPRIAVPTGAWLTTATPDQILVDLNTIVDQVWTLTERVHRPNTIILPLAQFRHLMTTPRSGTSDTTIAEFFLRTNGFVRELMSLPEMSTASATGGAAMLAYQKDPSILSGIVPLEFQQMDAQVHGFEVLIPAREKLGGTVWFYPFAAAFGDGI